VSQPQSIACLILPAALAFSSFLVAHIAAWQVLAPGRKSVALLTALALASYPASVVFCPFVLDLTLAQHLWTSLPCFAFLIVLYFHFYFGVDRSLSIRILQELVESDTGSVTLEQLDAVYPKQDMVSRRVAVLVNKGYLEPRDAAYACTPRGRVLVRLALLGKRLYNLSATG